jgi:lysosomal acid lipase/cholesteryl ester hydrolase
MYDGSSRRHRLLVWALLLLAAPGCASMRRNAPSPDLRPCDEGFAATKDGWLLGMRRVRPSSPDPAKLPVVLCHGLGLNGTFWTITDDHLPGQLAARGYEVFIVDMRGSGASHRVGWKGKVNGFLRQTPIREAGARDWNVDDEARYDVPAILEYVRQETGSDRVNWVGHSLGGMLMFPFLEFSPEAGRISNFVDMGGVAMVVDTPDIREMRRANKALRVLSLGLSTGRLGRPMMYGRLPGLEMIDRFYYTAANVDKRTVSRFYGYTLEDPGAGALKQLDPYLWTGHMLSADKSIDYASALDRITTPTLMVAGEGDVMADIPSTLLTFRGLGSADKSLMRFGRLDGHLADYGHCDLVWSRNAPSEVFPPLIDWLDARQPGVVATRQTMPSPQHASEQGAGGDR